MVLSPKLIVAASAAALVLSGTASQAGATGGAGTPVRIDLTASSRPLSIDTPDHDVAFRVDAQVQGGVRADTTATASAGCPDCRGQAISVQVLYVEAASSVRLDNAAVAWSQGCARCRTTAVSVQVVVMSGAAPLTANNRALALNAACQRCRARSAAYQLVMAGAAGARLSDGALASLRAWALDRARLLRTQETPTRQRSGAPQVRALDTLTQIVEPDVGSQVAAAHARLAG